MEKITEDYFDAEKLHLVNFKILEENTLITEIFDENLIIEFDTSNKIDIAYNIEEGLIRSQFDIGISTISGNNNEASAQFKFIFIFHCENFHQLIKDIDEKIKINRNLGIAISTITHSTVRGILLVKLSDTVFSEFILPIIKPKLPK